MMNRTNLKDAKRLLEEKYGFSPREATVFVETADIPDLNVLATVPDEQILAMQIVLFRIMTTPYNLDTQRVIFDMDYTDVIREADSILNGNPPTYDGHYELLAGFLRLNRLHLTLISNAVWNKLITCANYYNENALDERKNSVNLLARPDYKSGLERLNVLSLNFNDKIKILQTLNPIQVRVLKTNTNLYYLRSHIEWVMQTLTGYYSATAQEARSIAVSMLLQEPQPNHLQSLGRVLFNYYRFIFTNSSVDFNESVAQHYNSIPKVRYKNTFCHLLGNSKERSLSEDVAFSKMQNLQKVNEKNGSRLYCADGMETFLFLLIIFGAMGYCYYLYNRLSPVKSTCCRRFGFIHNMSSKKNDVKVADEKNALIPKPGRHLV
jgi:hypothetical protein